MLQINHLTITHRRDLRTVLDDFNFVLNPGDRAVIVGEEGNGKSTLLKWIFDPALIASYADAEGTRATRGEAMGYLPQELPAADKEKTVYDFFSEREAFQSASPRTLASLANRLGLDDSAWYAPQPMATLSGGEKVKLQMAALLLAEPDILLLDEPSNDVDVETLEWMEELIAGWRGGVLFISHDETLIERTANRVVLLEQLRRKTASRWTVANMPFRQFMAERAALFDKQAQLAGSERREEKKALEKFRRIQQSVERAQENISRADPAGGRLLKKKMASVKAMEKRYAREHEDMTAYPEAEAPILIRFHDLPRLPAGKTVLDCALPELRCGERVLARNVALRVRGPEKVGITGKNGAGKTTLLRAVHKMLRPRDDLRVFYMPQDYEELLDLDETPLDCLVPSGDREALTTARTYLGSLRYTAEEMFRPARGLSGGQKAKLLLLKLSLSETNVLLLDEPTRNFSPLSGPEIRALLRGFPGAIISVSHDRRYLAEVCDTVYRLTEDGLVLQ
ncbi:MAG: ABC-F family ATP-binding cassette domain-containing protein [Ruminococcaceae bacterium]|nr:ABC-F family ATP-binding cassette domain-containing protein [Oscillospiraceae bacterium]